MAEIEKVMKIKKHLSDQEPGPNLAPLKSNRGIELTKPEWNKKIEKDIYVHKIGKKLNIDGI